MPRRFVFGALAAVQFLPALTEEARMARMITRAALPAGTSRGRQALAGFNPALGIILLAGAIRRAGTAALAMELRGLTAAASPSDWRVPRPTRRDLAFAVVAIAVLPAIALLA